MPLSPSRKKQSRKLLARSEQIIQDVGVDTTTPADILEAKEDSDGLIRIGAHEDPRVEVIREMSVFLFPDTKSRLSYLTTGFRRFAVLIWLTWPEAIGCSTHRDLAKFLGMSEQHMSRYIKAVRRAIAKPGSGKDVFRKNEKRVSIRPRGSFLRSGSGR